MSGDKSPEYLIGLVNELRKLPAETWAALEETLALAPSSFGLQPYRVLVVDDPAMREKLLPHARAIDEQRTFRR